MTPDHDILPPRTISDGSAPVALYVDDRIEPDERAVRQLRALSHAPGVEPPVVALPDIHYKGRNPAPTGSVVAVRDGIIPLAIDAGINCGMRVHVLDMSLPEMPENGLEQLFAAIRRRVPTGWHETPVLDDDEMAEVLRRGAAWVLERTDGRGGPVGHIENGGALPVGDVRAVIPAGAWRRGRRGLGVLGGGNHFLELHVVQEVLHPHAERLGIAPDQLLVIMHSGSGVVGKTVGLYFGPRDERSGRSHARFLAEKVGYHLRPGDYLERIDHFRRNGFRLLPSDSREGRRCLEAMAAASNFGYANRTRLGAMVEEAVSETFGLPGASLLYDVSHNMVQPELHHGQPLFIHRQGASRAWPPSRMAGDPVFSVTGQPFPVPGSMGAESYICVGRESGERTYYSANHGAGRLLDKPEARQAFDAGGVQEQMSERRIMLFKEGSEAGLAEQAPGAFKDITAVIDVMEKTGIAHAVARTIPLAVLKG